MTEPTIVPPGQPGDHVDYRPISPLAIAGLVCSGLFTLVMVLSVTASLLRGGPVSYFWILLLPVVGTLLSLAALRQIRLSEGTRAGESIARLGLYLGIITGLSYAAYYFATGMAVRQQANAFLTTAGPDAGFFPLLREGKVNAAFLLTLPYRQRKGLDPQDTKTLNLQFDANPGLSGRGDLSGFRESDPVQLLALAGRDESTKIVPRGIKNWSYDAKSKSYVVERHYEIVTDEMTMDVLVQVKSTDTTTGEGRKWFVVRPIQLAANPVRTERGKGLQVTRATARAYAMNVFERLQRGLPVTDPLRDLTDWTDLSVEGEFVRNLLRQDVQGHLAGQKPGPRRLDPIQGDILPVREADGLVEVSLPFYMAALAGNTEVSNQYTVGGEMILRSKQPFDPADPPPVPEWEAVGYKIDRVTESSEPLPGR